MLYEARVRICRLNVYVLCTVLESSLRIAHCNDREMYFRPVGILLWIRMNLTGYTPKSILRVAFGIFMQSRWTVTSIALLISDSRKRRKLISIYFLYSCYNFSRHTRIVLCNGNAIGFNDIAEAAERRAFLHHEASFFLSWLYRWTCRKVFVRIALSTNGSGSN